MIVLILFFTLSIIFSFLCSIWEAVLLSITPSFVRSELEKGTALGKTLQSFKDDIDRPLSGILTLNTIAHTVGAIGVGAQAGALFGDGGGFDIGPLHLSGESIVATVMTLAILILSEIIPKTLGANNWRALASFTVTSLSILLTILAPFIWMSSLITKKMKKDKTKSVLTRADFMAQVNVGMSSGAIKEDESAIISNLLRLEFLKVEDIMTPRVVLHSISEDTTLQTYFEGHEKMRFSRIPVFAGKADNITGVVLKYEILRNIIDGKGDQTMAEIKRPIKIVSEDSNLRHLFELLTEDNDHVAIVNDNYGSITGVVTMEDLVETILGLEIVDETDGVADMQALARKIRGERAKKLGQE